MDEVKEKIESWKETDRNYRNMCTWPTGYMRDKEKWIKQNIDGVWDRHNKTHKIVDLDKFIRFLKDTHISSLISCVFFEKRGCMLLLKPN